MKVIVFLILSLPLLALSWRALFSLKNHGLYRLVVFECILWLAIQNYRYLIVEEFDFQQLVSSVFMITSLVFVLSAVLTMRKKGRVSKQRQDHTLLGFEKTTVLIESGIFKHVRHPMYSSLLFLAWGILLRHLEVTLSHRDGERTAHAGCLRAFRAGDGSRRKRLSCANFGSEPLHFR
ncbi:MAG: hypothetical protein EHM37_00600 [Deltaproteobacteria bacterium]|nr:MAG: hypothetical protein EHM37_13460 [Deltaproteobacteria bacterium]RPJ14515.1 MAG: hypothetical protein EHM37_05695 [Deltaproteobacteria bacterium]RPJ17512.1 MAG: hypothetical protein EHM37_00600 [Deltaproteobacteria bacterium]